MRVMNVDEMMKGDGYSDKVDVDNLYWYHIIDKGLSIDRFG
jgi:hypothetical protein